MEVLSGPSAIICAQTLRSGKYMVLVRGLSAPASQSLPPLAWGQVSTCCPAPVKMSSGFSVTAPDAPSMWLMTFWVMVGVAHRNSPVSRSRV